MSSGARYLLVCWVDSGNDDKVACQRLQTVGAADKSETSGLKWEALSTVYEYKLTYHDLSGPTTTKLLTIKQCPTSSLTMSHFLAICLDHSNLKRALIGSCLLARIRHNQSSISYYHHTGAFDYITNSLSWSSECHAYAVCVWICQESGPSASGRLLSIPSQPPCKLVHL